MAFHELNPGEPPPAQPAIPETLYHVSNGMRSQMMIEQLIEAGTDYAYINDPDDLRWILSLEQWHKGTGMIVVYETDRCNIATAVGHTPFGYQDTVRTIINRSRGYRIVYDPPKDLNPQLT